MVRAVKNYQDLDEHLARTEEEARWWELSPTVRRDLFNQAVDRIDELTEQVSRLEAQNEDYRRQLRQATGLT
jgi:acyl-CoA reductase-like NAD-dependent aldehyde dehydrogenase